MDPAPAGVVGQLDLFHQPAEEILQRLAVQRFEMRDEAVEDAPDVLGGDRAQRLRGALFRLRGFQFTEERRALPLRFLDLLEENSRRLGRGGELAHPVDAGVQRGHAVAKRTQRIDARRGGDPAGFGDELLDERVGMEVLDDPFDDRLLERCAIDSPALADPVGAVPAPVPRVARWRPQQTGEQVGRGASAGGRTSRFEAREDRLGFLGRDQRLMRVVLHDPLRARAAFAAALVVTVDPLGLDVPHGVAGIGEGVSLEAQQRRLWRRQPGFSSCRRSRQSFGARLQVRGDAGSAGVADQPALRDGDALAHRAGRHPVEPVAHRGASACTPALADVLRHSRESFLAAHQGVELVECLEDGSDDQVHQAVGLRDLRVDDADAALLALVVQRVGEVLVARDPRGVEREQVGPGARRVPEAPEESLEARSLIVFPGLDGVGELLNDRQVPRFREREQLAPLGVERDVVAILAAPHVERCLIHVSSTRRR